METNELASVRWIHGSPDGTPSGDPPIQVVAIDDDTFVLRQGKHVHFEAPFSYLLLGTEVALLHDTGATPEPERFPIRRCVEDLIGRRDLRIVVTHSHGHGDHWAGDAQFRDPPSGSVAPIGEDAVAGFFGIVDRARRSGLVDLGDRSVEVLPAPGHLADHVVLLDRARGVLLTGDTLLPGRLTVRDWEAFRATVGGLARLARETADAGRPIRMILGGHIELDREGELYELGTTYQPNEAPLPLSVDDLFELERLLAVAGSPARLRGARFVVEPMPGA